MNGTFVLPARQHPRALEPGVGSVNVSVFRAGAWSQIGPAQLVDISAGGLGIHAEREILPETCMKVTTTGVSCTGIVRYCIRRGQGFRVGMQFVDLQFTEGMEADDA